MPSSWNVYYVVFLSALLALGIPALLGLFSYLVSAERRASGKLPAEIRPPSADASRVPGLLSKRINARFFMGVNAALVLIGLGLALIPCAGMLQQSADREGFLRGLVAIISLSAFCGLGLLYSASKGDLSWIQSFQENRFSDRNEES